LEYKGFVFINQSINQLCITIENFIILYICTQLIEYNNTKC